MEYIIQTLNCTSGLHNFFEFSGPTCLVLVFSIPKSQMFMHDVSLFQQDLDSPSCWSATWQMNFNFIKCNIMSITSMIRPKHTTESLVRPHVEYESAAWSPFEKRHIQALEAVQRCAIWFVCSDYSEFSSVTSMQDSLGWDTLEVSLHLRAATTMYKAVHNRTHSRWFLRNKSYRWIFLKLSLNDLFQALFRKTQ